MPGNAEDTRCRITIIRQLPNKIPVVPNSTVAASIVTNYHTPEHEMPASVQYGVIYNSDLEHVEVGRR